MNFDIKKYYRSNKSLIERSITSLFPEKCTDSWVKSITARDDRPWDTKTLQTAFLDPIHKSLKKKKSFNSILGSVLLLKSSGINPEKNLQLLAMGESFGVSLQLLKDIAIHESHEQQLHEELKIKDSIDANVGVALLTLSYYPILHNHYFLRDETRLWLYQRTTTSVSRIVFAIGTGYYRKIKKKRMSNIEYLQHAAYLSGQKLQFSVDLWLALSDHYKSASIVITADELIQNFSLAYQLNRNLHQFNEWVKNNKNHKNAADSNINSPVVLNLCKVLSDEEVLGKRLSTKKLIDMVNQTGIEKQILNQIENNLQDAWAKLKQLPFPASSQEEIKSYIQFILNDFK